ncbi:MAG: aminomethyl-transferring glycine dehydrogenase subunit GcvPA [Nitrosomonadaceae bacterium]|nr:aminomethyl-transferring glycine dehydrogenase subunit GcvPA [Nitrosospira sp.]MDW7598856.1 aminomethyl-transferring glycine dehydrogenase subunit GcvPA [Nitrosomonadaceae bacterium]MBI0410093.1 aminomethyl-transferring glycine dehydrogenase subunit GcvPA [Nitrosospira sp.]MBI0411889.1 aminomethyl-transferring glycine dehydrogenase subunit GcvPA [Nitrosospira sp.]MDW7618871.1 aminomethyl-transferring glycine dehydrogenase subunit GcvPA [Nitrosomonadaceae bacterium]
MPFIPHTEEDISTMLASIGANTIEDLFDEIPLALKSGSLKALPGLSEMEISRLMQDRAEVDGRYLNFIGAGAYEHHIPSAVWQITTRGEFYSSYTPYQAEASQGTLQLLYEYQTMMASLTGMDVSNASMYDGASALAEAALMAVRSHKSSRRILIPTSLHPIYRRVVRAIVKNQGIEVIEIPYNLECGHTLVESLAPYAGQDIAALVIPQPNFFGVLEPVDALTDWAHANSALAIGVVNPMSLALLTPPGEWGSTGADVAVGEGQPLGIPLSSGGPYFGFMACKQALIRQMPGRIIGRTTDLNGNPGFVLTLQAREQHIRRSKATSNICTNQGLMVTAATIYMSLLGPEGLRRVATQSHANTLSLAEQLETLKGVKRIFSGDLFHETVVTLPAPVAGVLKTLKNQGVLAGLDLSEHYPELDNALLVCATETKIASDLEKYVSHLAQALS